MRARVRSRRLATQTEVVRSLAQRRPTPGLVRVRLRVRLRLRLRLRVRLRVRIRVTVRVRVRAS